MSIAIIENLILESPREGQGHEELLRAIEHRVAEMLEQEPELLFSYLYRLDVSESMVRVIISNRIGDTVKHLSRLILDRQLSRVETKKNIPQNPIPGWEW